MICVRVVMREVLSLVAMLLLGGLFVLLALAPACDDSRRSTGDVPVRRLQAAVDDSPALVEVIERHVTAVGGREAIEQLGTRVCTGRQIDDRPYHGPTEVIPLETWSKFPDRWIFILQQTDMRYREGADGRVSWQETADGVVQHDHLERSRLAWLLDPHGSLRLAEYFPGMRLKGRETIGDREVYVVGCDLDDAHHALYFDTETGLLNRIGYYWELSDYRAVDGVSIPCRVERSRKVGSATCVLDEVKHLTAIDESRFAVPERSRHSGTAERCRIQASRGPGPIRQAARSAILANWR